MAVTSQSSNPPELVWLLDASESLLPLSESNPIYVRHGTIEEGPPRPHPEWHPYCEISIRFEGDGAMFVENEKAHSQPGDVLLLGPGVPHWGTIDKYPLRFERRRSGGRRGGVTYTWAYVTMDGAEHSLGDPWPSVRVPKKELAQAIQNLLDRRK